MKTRVERHTDRHLLRQLINAHGENAKAQVSIGAKVGLSTLEKLMAGTYGRVPREAAQERLAMFLGVKRDSLFPLVGASGKKRTA